MEYFYIQTNAIKKNKEQNAKNLNKDRISDSAISNSTAA